MTRLGVTKHWETTGGIFTVVLFAVHWGNRVIGFTLLNFVLELEF